MIPSCLVEWDQTLIAMNLAENNLVGNISGTFPRNCALKTLDLHGNLLEGRVPESLSNCMDKEVLNLGKNQINDTFPCWLKNLSSFCVLVLQSNKFHGDVHCLGANITWPNLQIIALASNNLSSILPTNGILNWRAMMVNENEPI